MPLMKPLDVFVSQEWDRFKTGLAGIDPGGGVDLIGRPRKVDQPVAGTGTITIPGWDQVIKLGPGPVLTSGDFKAYYQALRAGTAPALSDETLRAVQQALATRAAQKSSVQPGYSLAIGQIMTAIDNYQDFLSTLATVGRLALWAAPRIGLRAVPVVGHIVLAADILNLFNFVGMIATPLYALLCGGPRDALAAGIPAAVLKNALCREMWKQVSLNPFSKKARAARHFRALGRLPGLSNLIEVLQTTDTLFGYGISIGALYGTAMEVLYAGAHEGGVGGASLNVNLAKGSLGGDYRAFIMAQPPGAQRTMRQAALVAQMAPVLAGQHDMFPDRLHYEHMAAQLGAVSTVAEFFRAGDAAGLMAELLPGLWPAPSRRPAYLDDLAPGITDDDAGVGRWWIDGYPKVLAGEQLIAALARPVTAAVSSFVIPRRARPEATFYGAALNQITEHWWYVIGEGEDALRSQLMPDYLILTSMMVEGLLVRQREHEGRLWRFWLDLRAQTEANGERMLERDDILGAERRSGITLMRLLPVQAPFPVEWEPYFRDPTGFSTWAPAQWPGLMPGSSSRP